jgi:hypothetical protein
MTKQNPYFLKENLPKKTEEIRKIDYQVPSFEEFKETYQEDEKTVEFYEEMFRSWDWWSETTKSCGPGMSPTEKRWTKFGISTAIGIGCAIFPPAAIPVAIGAATASSCKLIVKIGGDNGSKEDQLLNDIGDVGIDVLAGQITGGFLSYAGSYLGTATRIGTKAATAEAATQAAQVAFKDASKEAGKKFGKIAATEIAKKVAEGGSKQVVREAAVQAARQSIKNAVSKKTAEASAKVFAKASVKAASRLGCAGHVTGHALGIGGSAALKVNNQIHENEREELIREQERRINEIKTELRNIKQELSERNIERTRIVELENWVEELKNEVRELKKELCKIRGCDCGGDCILY